MTCPTPTQPPAPGLGLPPNAPLLMLVFALVVLVPLALLVNYGRNSGSLAPVLRRTGFRLAAAGYLAILAGQFVIDFVVLPSDSAVRAWASAQYTGLLATHCSTAAVFASETAAQNTVDVVRWLAVVLAAIGVVLIVLGYFYRNSGPPVAEDEKS